MNSKYITMRTKIYISRPDMGWTEVDVPEKYRYYSYEALIKVVHQFVDVESCKGILITENPNPFSKIRGVRERMSA